MKFHKNHHVHINYVNLGTFENLTKAPGHISTPPPMTTIMHGALPQALPLPTELFEKTVLCYDMI